MGSLYLRSLNWLRQFVEQEVCLKVYIMKKYFYQKRRFCLKRRINFELYLGKRSCLTQFYLSQKNATQCIHRLCGTCVQNFGYGPRKFEDCVLSQPVVIQQAYDSGQKQSNGSGLEILKNIVDTMRNRQKKTLSKITTANTKQ